MNRSIAVALLTLGLAGCTGPPTTYLTLASTQGVAHPQKGPPLAVAHVEMPASIDRIYLTTALGMNTVHVASHARWTAPLGGLVREALARDLAARLPGRRVLMPGDPVPPHTQILHVNITRFMPYPGHVVLDADWQVHEPEHGRQSHGRLRIIEPAGDTAAAQARAMSVALGDLADTIAGRMAQ